MRGDPHEPSLTQQSSDVMTGTRWKFSQVASLSFIALLLVAAFVGIVGADNGLMSDGVAASSLSSQIAS